MKFRAAFNWGKVLGESFGQDFPGSWAGGVSCGESSMQAKWARLERCAVPVVDPDTPPDPKPRKQLLPPVEVVAFSFHSSTGKLTISGCNRACT